MKPMPLLLSLLLLLTLAACTQSSTIKADSWLAREDKSGQSSDGFPAPSRHAVWETAMHSVREQGFVPDPTLSRPETARVVSRWQLSMHPFSGQGHRDRVTVQVLPVQGKPDYYRLSTNVMRQVNDNVKDPSNPISAEWAEGKRRPALEGLINQRIEMYFLPSDVSPEFRKKYGMRQVQGPRDQEAPQEPKAAPPTNVPGY